MTNCGKQAKLGSRTLEFAMSDRAVSAKIGPNSVREKAVAMFWRLRTDGVHATIECRDTITPNVGNHSFPATDSTISLKNLGTQVDVATSRLAVQ